MLHEILCKVVIVGDSGVGKTNLLLRMTRDEFVDTSRTTIGVDFSSVTIDYEQARVKAAIWDTAGQERYRAIGTAMYRGARGALIVYDISSRASFENARLLWLRELRMHSSAGVDLNIMLVGNKSDLLHLRAVSTKEARSFAEEEGLMFMETSARDAVNVRKAFQMLLQEIADCVLNQVMPFNENGYSTIRKTNTINIPPNNDSDKTEGGPGCQC